MLAYMEGVNAGSDAGDMPADRRPKGYTPGALALPLEGPGVFAGVFLAWPGGRSAVAGSREWTYSSDRSPELEARVCESPLAAAAMATRHRAMSVEPSVHSAVSGPREVAMLANRAAVVLARGDWPSPRWMVEALAAAPSLSVEEAGRREPGADWLARRLARMPERDAVEALSATLMPPSLAMSLGKLARGDLAEALARSVSERVEVSMRGHVVRKTAFGYFLVRPCEEHLSNFTLDVAGVSATGAGVTLMCRLDFAGRQWELSLDADALGKSGVKVARAVWEAMLRQHQEDLPLRMSDAPSDDWLTLAKAFNRVKLVDAADPLGVVSGWARLPCFKVSLRTGELVRFASPAKALPRSDPFRAVRVTASPVAGALAVLAGEDSHSRAIAAMACHLLHQTLAPGMPGVAPEHLVAPVDYEMDYLWESAARSLWCVLSGRNDMPDGPRAEDVKEFRKQRPAGSLPFIMRMPSDVRKPIQWLHAIAPAVIVADAGVASHLGAVSDVSYIPCETTEASDRLVAATPLSALEALRDAWPELLSVLCKSGLPAAPTASESARTALSAALGVDLPSLRTSRAMEVPVDACDRMLAVLAKTVSEGKLETGHNLYCTKLRSIGVIKMDGAVGIVASRCAHEIRKRNPELARATMELGDMIKEKGYDAPTPATPFKSDRICLWIKPEVWARFLGVQAGRFRVLPFNQCPKAASL
jgi:hypothetical protein